MLDTIKVGIPISKSQYVKIEREIRCNEGWKWIQFNAQTGELKFLRYKGLMQTDQHSYRREIFWDISDVYIDGERNYLTLEFSVPKFWYGHNISLLYDWVTPLKHMKKLLQNQLKLRLPKVDNWELFKADVCYAWRCPSQKTASLLLESLKQLNFPWKKPTIYEDSIVFVGTTYSFKFYLKLPEFIAHDRKALLKTKASLDWINYLEDKATGILRCEATLRRKYLKRHNIYQVGDLFDGTKFLLDLNLDKFLGESKSMSDINAIRAKLFDAYKSHKAARLMGFWLAVQHFGEKQAKADYGRDSFYDAKKDLKKAGVTLIGKPEVNEDTEAQKFIDNFEFKTDSPYVVNQYDDYRDSENVLNFNQNQLDRLEEASGE